MCGQRLVHTLVAILGDLQRYNMRVCTNAGVAVEDGVPIRPLPRETDRDGLRGILHPYFGKLPFHAVG
jgi:hypothetical protein